MVRLPCLLLVLTGLSCGEYRAPPIENAPDASEDPCGDEHPSTQILQMRLLALVNGIRSEGALCGPYGAMPPVKPIRMEHALNCAGLYHSMDMAKRHYFEHASPDGKRVGERVTSYGYAYEHVGENLALGMVQPEQVVDAWLKSTPHCMNMLSPTHADGGVGLVVQKDGRALWTMILAKPDASVATPRTELPIVH